VRPTRPGTLLALVLGPGLLAYLVAALAYGSLPVLPSYAPVSIVVLAVAELAIAKVVRDRLNHRLDARGRPRGRPLHPMQVARAAVLAKASSAGGAVALGVYAGLLAWTLPRRSTVAATESDTTVAAVSVLACLGLVIAALLLERACRRPDDDEDAESLESGS
jgi:FtsH-binding integral membrane protein